MYLVQVFSAPKDIEIPTFDFNDVEQSKLKEEEFINNLVDYCKRNNSSEHAGKIIQFPVADSYAQYMIFSIEPTWLIHLPIGDGWQFDYIERLTKEDILDKIKNQEALNKTFNEG